MHLYKDDGEFTIESVASQTGCKQPSELNVYGFRFLVCLPVLEQQLASLDELGLIIVKQVYFHW